MISTFSSQNWISLTLLFLLVILVLVKVIFTKRFADFVSISNKNEYFIDYIEKSPSIFDRFNMFFLVFHIGVFALLLVLIDKLVLNNIRENSFYFFLQTTLLIVVFYSIRYVIGFVVFRVLGMKTKQITLTYMKLSYLSKISIFILPMLIISIYIVQFNTIFIKITAVATLFFLVFNYGQIMKKNQNIVFNHLFYFILYLCALEITPLLILYKLFISKV